MGIGSKTDIVNLALTKLGHTTILTFNDESRAAALARASYDHILDSVLRAHPWNFATARASLTADATAPAWEFAYQYPLPANPYCLRPLEVELEDSKSGKWRVEGRMLLTDFASPINLRYIYRNLDTGAYDPLFIEALSARLASDWAEPLVRASTVTDTMFKLYAAKLAEARSIDGQEGTPFVQEKASWIDAR